MIDEKVSLKIKKQELEKRLDELTFKKNNLLANLNDISSVINKEKSINNISKSLLIRYELNGLVNFDLKIALKTTLYDIKKSLTSINGKIDSVHESLNEINICPDCMGAGFQTTHYIERSLGTPTESTNSVTCQKCNGTGEV